MNIFDEAKEHFKNLKREIQSTAKILIKSSKKWGKISSVPSVDADVVLTFPSNSDMNLIKWFTMELECNVPELSFRLTYHRNADEYALYLTASYKNLLRGAELLNMRKRVSDEFGGGCRDFNLEELDIFQDVSVESIFFNSQQRQSIVKYWLYSLRSSCEINQFGLTVLKGQKLVPLLISKSKINQIFPLHDQNMLNKFKETWVAEFSKFQPLNEIADYYGVKNALYFAWLGQYTTALLFPTIIGIVTVIGQKIYGNHDICFLLIAFFNILWATFYFKSWRRTCSELTYQWGTIDYQINIQSEERPEFRGEPRLCPLTGQQMRYYPFWKRQLIFYFISLPVIFICVMCTVGVSIFFSAIQVWFDDYIVKMNLWRYLSYLPKILLALVIGLMDDVYKSIAINLNKLENHRMEESYRNYLMAKLILFQFMNSFFSLFHVAFYLKDMAKLRELLGALFVIRQFLGNFKEIAVPLSVTRLRQMLMEIRYEKRKMESRVTESPVRLNRDSFESFTPTDEREILNLGKIDETSVEYCKVTHRPNKINLKETFLTSNVEGKDKLTVSNTEASATSNFDEINSFKQIHHLAESSDICNEADNTAFGQYDMERRPSGDRYSLRRSTTCASTPMETTLVQAEKEATLPKYDDPFEDFLEMFIQYGYFSMFSCVFPLAGFFCLLNNFLEIRSDAFKLISSFQRPFGENVSSIGIWQMALEALSYVAISVNVGLLYVSGGLCRILPNFSTIEIIITIVIIEHVVILIKFLIEQAVPNVPYWIEHERSVIEHKRREALKEIEKEAMKERRNIRGHSCEPPETHEESRDLVSVNSVKRNRKSLSKS